MTCGMLSRTVPIECRYFLTGAAAGFAASSRFMTSSEMFSPVFTQTAPESAMLSTRWRPFSFAT